MTKTPQIPPYESKAYDNILDDHRQWPIVKLNARREQFVQEVIDVTVKRILDSTKKRGTLTDHLERTMFSERLRIKQNPWKADPDDEEDFWRKVKGRLLDTSQLEGEARTEAEEKLLYDIVHRYAEEIVGSFQYNTYQFARRFVTFGFARLLNAFRLKKFSALFRGTLTLQDKINLVGETEHIRKLAKIGTVIMVPTHFSNLDSILVGWAIQALGLPPFIYGAGLNLFTIKLISYFMKNLGAYKVDRRKKNMIYLETLKNYSTLAIEAGTHSLFFPGGTRSRSGQLESHLKLGLLNTAIEAQRMHFQKHEPGTAPKIFVVPVVFNYHFVLEAPSLIKDYLKREGQERYYVENDEYSSSYKIATFLLRFIRKGSDISVSFGKGMDLLGNYVDDEGRSYDTSKRPLMLREYFSEHGKITVDKQRESEYTRRLGERITEEYLRINRVFSSHLVAFVAFQMLRQRNPKLDLYELLRIPDEAQVLDYADFREQVARVREVIFEKYDRQELDLAPHMTWDIDKLIDHGLDNVGLYHTARPLLKNKQGNIYTKELNTLYYYHNRLMGYGFEKLFE